MTKEKKKRSVEPKKGSLFGSSRLEVPDYILEEAAKLGLEVRWISVKELQENQNSHHRLWQAWKWDSKREKSATEIFAFGNDPEGLIRRGDLVLGARPIEIGDEHRAELEKARARYRRYKQTKQKEFSDYVRQEGRGAVGADVDE